MIEKKTLEKLYGIYFSIFIVLGSMVGIGYGLVKELEFTIFILIISVISIFTYIKNFNFPKDKNEEQKLILFIIIGVILRILYFYLVDVNQISDFDTARRFYFHLIENGEYQNYEILKSKLDFYQRYFSSFPAWFIYDLIQCYFYKIFGYHREIILFMNLVLYISSSIFIFKVLAINFNLKIAKNVIFLYSFYPQLIMWSSVSTPDHFILFFMSLLIFIWGIYLKIRGKNFIKDIFFVILIAFTANLINLFKPISIFFLLVYLSSEVLILIKSRVNIKKKKFIEYHLIFIVFFIFFYIKMMDLRNNKIEELMKVKVQQANAYYILWGYSVDKNKNWSDKVGSEIISSVSANTLTLEEEINKLEEIAKDELKKNIQYIPKILLQKAIYLFSSENWAIYWTNTSKDILKKEFIEKNIQNKIGAIMTIFNSFIMLFIPFSLYSRKKLVNILSLTWLGYMILLIFSGIQTRYRCIVYIQQIILSVIGFQYFVYIVKRKIKRRKNGKNNSNSNSISL